MVAGRVGEGRELSKGTRVQLDVTWFNGRTARMTGSLIAVQGDEAYVQTSVGAVVGPVDSLEVIEDTEVST